MTGRKIKQFKINQPDAYGFTPIFHAVQNGDVKETKDLLKTGADLNYQNPQRNNNTVLHYSNPTNGKYHSNCFKELIKGGANPNIQNATGKTAVHTAAENNNVEALEIMLEGKIRLDLNITDDNGYTPLYYAVYNKKLEAIEFLVSEGADLSVVVKGRSILHLAIETEDKPTLELVLESFKKNNIGVDIQSNSTKLTAPFYYAIKLATQFHDTIKNGYYEMAEILLLQGANPDQHLRGKQPALHHVVGHNYLEAVQLLLDYNADPDKLDKNKTSAVHLATSKGNIPILKELIRKNADLNLLDKNKIAALHIAAFNNNVSGTKLLISNGADTNIKGSEGRTPLHMAADRGNIKIVKELCKINNTQRDVKDDSGYTPLDYATSRGFSDIVDYLTTLGVKHQAIIESAEVVEITSDQENLQQHAEVSYKSPKEIHEYWQSIKKAKKQEAKKEQEHKLSADPVYQWFTDKKIYSSDDNDIHKIDENTYALIKGKVENKVRSNEIYQKFVNLIADNGTFVNGKGKAGLKDVRGKLIELKILGKGGDIRFYTNTIYEGTDGKSLIIFDKVGNHAEVSKASTGDIIVIDASFEQYAKNGKFDKMGNPNESSKDFDNIVPPEEVSTILSGVGAELLVNEG